MFFQSTAKNVQRVTRYHSYAQRLPNGILRHPAAYVSVSLLGVGVTACPCRHRNLCTYVYNPRARGRIIVRTLTLPYSNMTVQGLTPEQLELWDKNGYLIIPDALSPETVQNLLSESHQLLEDFSLEGHPMTKFSTGTGPNSDKHVGDEYFLTSSSAIHFFFEEAAFDASGTLTKPKARAINKIGHALHVLSRPFAEATLTRENRDVARCLGFRDPRVLQSMVICKQPGIGGAVPPHQDSTFLYTDPPSAVGFWYALEDATGENGGLSFAPGSHRRVPVRKRFVKLADGGGTEFENLPEGKGEWC